MVTISLFALRIASGVVHFKPLWDFPLSCDLGISAVELVSFAAGEPVMK
jgi:hypothetical protein